MSDSYLPDLQRSLPQSPDAEQGLLGSILLNPDVLDHCAENGVNVETFHIPSNQIIFAGLNYLRDEGQPIDIISLTQFLRDKGTLDEAGGPRGVSILQTIVPTSANAAYYAAICAEKALLRSMIKVCTEYAARCYDEQDNAELITEVEQRILEISKSRHSQASTKTMKEHVMGAAARLSDIHSKTSTPGLMTGLRALDRKLGGFQRGEVTVLTGTTGGGKTSFAHTVLAHIAIDLKKPVMLFSYEMNALWVTNRLLCARSRINTEAIRTGNFNEQDFRSFTRHMEPIKTAPIFIEDNPDLSIDDIRARARRRKSTDNIALVIVDYIQKIVPKGKGHAMRQREVAQISDGLQKMAMELDVPVLVLAQQNPDGEAREARDIAFDAKVVLKIKRENEKDDIENEGPAAKRIIVICKNNTGSVGTVPITFLKSFVTFTDCETEPKEHHADHHEPR